MKLLRTPDAQFEGLPDFPFAPHYVDVDDTDGSPLRVHHLDEGPAEGAVVLLLHGEPSWSFLYRTMIPVLVDAGLRCIAPDLVGFGRSDKPVVQADYTFARHVEWMREALFDRLDLRDVTLVGQDWGGLIGLRLVGEHPERFARVVVANSGLPTGDRPLTDAFLAWQKFSQETPVFPVGGIVNAGADITRRPGRRGQPGRLGDAGGVRQAAADGVLRRRPHHPGRRGHLPAHGAWGEGAAPHDDRGRRPLPPGGQGPGAGPSGGRLRGGDPAVNR